MLRTTGRAIALALAAALAFAAPTLVQAQPRDDRAVYEASLRDLDAAIAAMDGILGRVDGGNLLLVSHRMMDLDPLAALVPVDREMLILFLRIEVTEGRLTPEQATERLMQIARETATYRAGLRAQRERLAARRTQTQLALSRLPKKPLQPWELGRPPAGPPAASGSPGAFKVFSAVPVKPSATFRGNTVGSLSVDTAQWDRTPYRITGDFGGSVTMPQGGRVVLAGDAGGTAGWSVDNFLYLDIGGRSLVIGAADPVWDGGGTVESISGGGVTDLTPYFRPGVATTVRIMALDYGGVGHVTDVYLVVR